ncbi:MAG: RagB/SusD family nutrient uptake outer membrane protein [Mangrovibacterium sp.]
MKKLFLILLPAFILLSGCESFLDTSSYTSKNSGNFPITEEDAVQLVTGIYNTFYQVNYYCGNSYYMYANLASDERFGGGGQDDASAQAVDKLMFNNINDLSNYWSNMYKGISRANTAYAGVDNILDEELKAQITGEILFLRAYFYFELAQMFGEVPLMSEVPQTVADANVYPEPASTEEIYGFIAMSLKKAIEVMPDNTWDHTITGSGHATKWAAEALLARVFLFYTGFYGKTELPLVDETTLTVSGSVSKDYVKGVLDDCVTKSGHGLISDFRSLWPYTNTLTRKDYLFIKNRTDIPDWVKDGENKEQVFSMKFSRFGSQSSRFANRFMVYFGVRDGGVNYDNCFPLTRGYGQGPVNTNLWEEWGQVEPNDSIRRAGSIWHYEDECIAGPQKYLETVMKYSDNGLELTGLWSKKWADRAYKTPGAGPGTSMWWHFTSSSAYYGDDSNDSKSGGTAIDICVIRYADVLLMRSELYGDAGKGLNEVRARAGLPAATGDLTTAIRNERRWELAFEGVRWGDMRRYGVDYCTQALEKQIGVKVYNLGNINSPKVMKSFGGGYTARYKATKGFFAIPGNEIDLSAGVLKQNEGWSGADAKYDSWGD